MQGEQTKGRSTSLNNETILDRVYKNIKPGDSYSSIDDIEKNEISVVKEEEENVKEEESGFKDKILSVKNRLVHDDNKEELNTRDQVLRVNGRKVYQKSIKKDYEKKRSQRYYYTKSRAQARKKEKDIKVGKRTLLAGFLILIVIPATILFGVLGPWDDRRYYWVSLIILFCTMFPFFMVFEDRKPQARELIVIATLSAIGVAGRSAFFMLPQFKPVVAVVIVSAVCFGAEAGFLVGAMTGFVSNFFFGQGPWTPWQMFGFGIIGFIAGILFKKGKLSKRKISLCIYGGLSTFIIYGFLLDTASIFMFSQGQITMEGALAIYASGVPFNFIHATATVFFLFVISKPMVEKLDRIKQKYGMIEP